MSLFKILLVAAGVLCILFSMAWGLLFGLTLEGPPISGVVGGLTPTAFAVMGTLCIVCARG